MSEGIRGHRRQRSKFQILSMMLVGAGLLLIGAIALLVLPQPKSTPVYEEKLTGASFSPVEMNLIAPDLVLSDISGREVSLDDHRGQVVLVNNWATWCPPCRAEMPTLEAYYQVHKNQGFVLIGIDAGDPEEEVAEFVEKYEISFPIWLDPLNRALDAFRNMALPSSYVINRDGVIVLAWSGKVTYDGLEKYITPLLKE